MLAGRLGGVGLDVYSCEPLAREGHLFSPLFGRDDVILFPHLTFFTVEAMQRLTMYAGALLRRCWMAGPAETLNKIPVIGFMSPVATMDATGITKRHALSANMSRG